jgi:PIN domain nuclease of toxin-antitoxin system
MVVLDTCAVLELFQAKPKLAKSVLAEVDREAHVLSVSFAEIALKVKLKKLILERSARALATELSKVPSVAILATSLENWFAAIELKWAHRDPADRLIVAYAKMKGATIVTSDQEIKRFYKACVWA